MPVLLFWGRDFALTPSCQVESNRNRREIFQMAVSMESDVLDSLNDLGYPEEVYKDEEFKKMLQEGPSVAFTQVCRF